MKDRTDASAYPDPELKESSDTPTARHGLGAGHSLRRFPVQLPRHEAMTLNQCGRNPPRRGDLLRTGPRAGWAGSAIKTPRSLISVSVLSELSRGAVMASAR